MKDGTCKDSCLFGEELVSYIYGELPVSRRATIEDHLLTCSDCVERFATVSESRLGVYEWHRDEFLPLTTPIFEIHYERPIVRSEPAFGWLDALRGLITPARLATAGGAFAVLAIAFWATYVFVTPSDQLAANVNSRVQPVIEPVLPASTVESAKGPQNVEPNGTVAREIKLERSDSTGTTQVVQRVRARVAPKISVRQNQTQAQAPRPVRAPRLGTYDEAEDTSLRLVDLVADIDTDDF